MEQNINKIIEILDETSTKLKSLQEETDKEESEHNQILEKLGSIEQD